MNIHTIKTNFKNTRKNALANPYLYGLKYIQRNCKDAYIEYLEGIIKSNQDLIQRRIEGKV